MHSFVFLTTLASLVAATPRQRPVDHKLTRNGIDGPPIAMTEWTVRADWSRCSNASAHEVVFQGKIAAAGVAAGAGIVDFRIPALAEGSNVLSLVMKPAGSPGLGSPAARPAMVDVQVSAAAATAAAAAGARGGPELGVATFRPAAAGATRTERLAQVAWFADEHAADAPVSQIGYAALQRNATSSAATTVNPSFLRVYYCTYPAI